MLSSVNSLSGVAALSLLGTVNPTTSSNSQPSVAQNLLQDVTGNTDDTFKAGKAIGKIIELVAGMKTSDAPASSDSHQLFTMDGAQRTDYADGSYSETKAGQGMSVSDQQFQQTVLDTMEQQAQSTGPDATKAKAYLAAYANGTMQKTDLSASQSVSSTMTLTNTYYSDGTGKGTGFSLKNQGLEDYMQAHTYMGDDGILHDNATGKYASINQNGTKISYVVF